MPSGAGHRRGSSSLLRVAGAAGFAIALLLPAVVAPSGAAPSRAELETAQQRLQELERDFQLSSERYNLLNEELTALQAEIAATELVVARIERRLRSRRASAVSLAVELYKGGAQTAGVEAVLSSESVAEIETRLAYLRASESAHTRVFERVAVDHALLVEKTAELEANRDRVARDRAAAAQLAAELQEKVEAQRDEIAELNALIEQARRRAAARAAREAARVRAAATSAPAADIVARPAPPPSERAAAAVEAALSQVGKPYRWGASGPDAYDCSGLTMWAWGRAGVSLPHNSGAQYAATPRVARGDWQPGDLLFFGSPIHHVGMYIGNGQMVEAPYSGQNVRVNSAHRSDYVGAGRPGT